ncbi:MAG: acyl carrier protein [Bacteroides sp.]|nr:phosphopantetheine-binding protein [Clostridia bacterium]
MDELLDILTEVNADVDFETCDTLIDDGILDSFDIVNIVGELNDAFDIEITPADIVPENFNSAEAMWDMIKRLQD